MKERMQKLPKNIVGVYYLFDKNEVVYIGASENIKSRLIAHYSNKEKEFDDFSFHTCDKNILFKAEAKAIRRYLPKYNKKVPALDNQNRCSSRTSSSKRTKTTAFAAKPSEHKRIKKVALFLGVGMSEFMSETVMKEVEKVEKREAREVKSNAVVGYFYENTHDTREFLKSKGLSYSFCSFGDKYLLVVEGKKHYESSNVTKDSRGVFVHASKYVKAEEL